MLFLDEGTPGLRISVEQGCIVHIDSSMQGSEWAQHAVVTVAPLPGPKKRPALPQAVEVYQMFKSEPPFSTHIHSEHHFEPVAAMCEWTRTATGACTYLQSGQLEAARPQQHMYRTVWSAVETTAPQLPAADIVWDTGTPRQLHGVQTRITGMDELCAVQSTLGQMSLCLIGDSLPGRLLCAVQVTTSSGSSVWTVQCRPNAAWGLAKSVNAELGQLMRCACTDNTDNTLGMTTLASTDESQVVVRGTPEAARLSPMPKPAAVGSPLELALQGRGSLQSLGVRPQSTQTGAILQVKAVGLNFRDVLNVMDMYPGVVQPICLFFHRIH